MNMRRGLFVGLFGCWVVVCLLVGWLVLHKPTEVHPKDMEYFSYFPSWGEVRGMLAYLYYLERGKCGVLNARL